MANFIGTARTNYFKVTDEAKYSELFEKLISETGIEDFTKIKDGTIYHGFGSFSSVDFCVSEQECDYNFDMFLEQLQPILPDGEAFIYQEVGHEKLRYVSGDSIIVTNKEIVWVDLHEETLKKAQSLLGNNFETELEY